MYLIIYHAASLASPPCRGPVDFVPYSKQQKSSVWQIMLSHLTDQNIKEFCFALCGLVICNTTYFEQIVHHQRDQLWYAYLCINRTNAGKNQMPQAGFESTTPRSHGRCSNHWAAEATTVEWVEKIKCPERDLNPQHPDLMEDALTTELPQWSEWNISYKQTSITRVDLSDDEQFVRNMPCYI